MNLPVINMFIGGLIKLVCTSILSGNPNLGIMGAPISAIIGYCAIVTLNLFSLRRCTKESPAIFKQLLRPLTAALLMGIVVLACRLGLEAVLPAMGLKKLVVTGLPVMVGVAIYAFAAIKLKAITREDCMLLPKGEKIANLLHL